MTVEKMQKRLYELYQLDWMMTHGCSLGRLMSELNNSGEEWHDQYIYDNGDGTSSDETGFHADVEALFSDWEKERGFTGGEIWSCFDEFCRAEMSDIGYIRGLLKRVPWEAEALGDAYDEWLKENGLEPEE